MSFLLQPNMSAYPKNSVEQLSSYAFSDLCPNIKYWVISIYLKLLCIKILLNKLTLLVLSLFASLLLSKQEFEWFCCPFCKCGFSCKWFLFFWCEGLILVAELYWQEVTSSHLSLLYATDINKFTKQKIGFCFSFLFIFRIQIIGWFSW